MIGIIVVYVIRPEAFWVMRRHLDFIRKNTPKGSYRIHAYAGRLSGKYLPLLQNQDDIELHDFPATDKRGSEEHAHYLDQLAAAAAASGADHICSMDVDSFPVRPDWAQVALGHIAAGNSVVSVLRKEDSDSVLTHPSFCLFPRAFLQRFRPNFGSPFTGRTDPSYAEFLRTTGQRPDTGIGIAKTIFDNGLAWMPLLRTNRHDVHPIMAGIYGDLVFHVGGSARAKVFHAEYADYRVRAPTLTVEEVRAAIHAANASTAQAIFKALERDPDGFISSLRSGQGADQTRTTQDGEP